LARSQWTDAQIIEKLDILPVGWEVFQEKDVSMDEILLAASKLGFMMYLFEPRDI
jgi:hypothetical protein